jgi:hypothetical protein
MLNTLEAGNLDVGEEMSQTGLYLSRGWKTSNAWKAGANSPPALHRRQVIYASRFSSDFKFRFLISR